MSGASTAPRYRVVVDENFHHADPDSRWTAGEFESAETAVAKARSMVDADLANLVKPGMTAAALLDAYKMFGDAPFLVALNGAPTIEFSAWKYAESRCAEICG